MAPKEREKKIAWYEASGECPGCYSKRMEAKKAAGYVTRTMHYWEYEASWFWCATANGSYDAKEKTIAVYIPDAYSGLENLIGEMAKNNREKGRRGSYEANIYVIKNALDAGKINQEQAKTIGSLKIREF